jgi:predicted transposase/invertase (TIGR01784 family)
MTELKLNKEEFRNYQESLNAYRDIKNSVDTAWEEGREEGEKKKQIEIAKGMKKDGMSIHLIVKYSVLSIEEIEGFED